MSFEDLVTRFGLPLAMLVVVTAAFVRGSVVPRFLYDEEHTDRLNAEAREKELGKLFAAALDELRKVRGAG